MLSISRPKIGETEISKPGGIFEISASIKHVGELAVGVYNVENIGVRAGF